MLRLFSCSKLVILPALGLTLAGALTLSGCGMGTTAAPNAISANELPSFAGTVYGGAAPITGSAVTLYATGTTGYGSTPVVLATTSTNATGGFSFTAPYNNVCPAGSYLYMNAVGGNPGAGTNNYINLVAAFGSCSALTGGTATYSGPSTVFINEATTVAAAYALGQFAVVNNGGSANATVYIGAPANNNATPGSASTTAVAGLGHAFYNAVNLVNALAPAVGGGGPSSGANTHTATTATAFTASQTAGPGVVPQALINGIANAASACVDSTGAASAACTAFNNATGASDIFSALQYIAAHPTLGGSTTACNNILGLVTPQSNNFFTPNVSTTNNDLSIAINYAGNVGSSIYGANSIAADLNDNVYFGNPQEPGTSNHLNIVSLASNGAYNGATSDDTTHKYVYYLSVDSAGHGYFSNVGGSSSNLMGSFATNNGLLGGAITLLTASSTGLAQKNYGLTIDQANNLWATQIASGAPILWKAAAATSPSFASVAKSSGTIAAPSAGNAAGVSLDPQQNVWVANNTSVFVLPNSGTSAAAPAYGNNLLTASPPYALGQATGIAFAGTSTSYTAWVGDYVCTGSSPCTGGIQSFTPTEATAPTITSVASNAAVSSTTINGTANVEADGLGNIWLADQNSSSVQQFVPSSASAGTSYKMLPCAGTTCATVFTGKPYSLAIDSAGSVWVTSPGSCGATGCSTNPGNVIQIIGTAAPTWPLLSLGKIGEPQ